MHYGFEVTVKRMWPFRLSETFAKPSGLISLEILTGCTGPGFSPRVSMGRAVKRKLTQNDGEAVQLTTKNGVQILRLGQVVPDLPNCWSTEGVLMSLYYQCIFKF